MCKEHNENEYDCLAVTSVKVSPFIEGESMGKILGFAEVVLNDQLCIRGLRIMDGVNGLYVAYPNDPFCRGEDYRSIVLPMKRNTREHIEYCVLEKYMYETGKANIKFDVKLTHKALCGSVLQIEIIATSETEAAFKAKENAIEILPSTKDKGEWDVLKVEQHE